MEEPSTELNLLPVDLNLAEHRTQREVFGQALFRAEDLTGLFGLKANTLEGWMREGKLGALKIGAVWYVPESALARMIKAGLKGPEPKPARRPKEIGADSAPPPRRTRPRPADVQQATSPELMASFETLLPTERTDQ